MLNFIALTLFFTIVALVPSQRAPGQQLSSPAVEKLGPTRVRVGAIQVETARREATVTGHINPVTTLEFLANTPGGMKAYESAITLDADGVTFNTALLLIGLDQAHARVPTRHLDPNPPGGDPVQIWVEWSKGA